MSRVAVIGLGWVLSLAVSTGCYSYKPVLAPRAGMEIRAQLNTEAAVRRSQGMEEPVVRLDGRIVEATTDELALDVLVIRSNSQFQNIELRDTVRLPRSEIQALLERKVSVVRSVLLVVGIGAGAFALVKGIDQVVGGTDDPPGGGNPTLTVPLGAWLLKGFLPVVLGPPKRK